MKSLATHAMLGVAGLLLATLFAAAALTNGAPPLISPPFVHGPTNLDFTPLSSGPIVYLDRKPDHSPPLKPGVYQTRPNAIILIVPESGLDNRCVEGASGDISKMPIAKPDVQAVPQTFP